MDNFSKRFQLVAYEKKVFQADIARALNKDKATVNRWWKGAITPGPRNMVELANYLGCDREWLEKGTGEPFPVSQFTGPIDIAKITGPNSLIAISGNQGTELNFTHTVNQKGPHGGTVALELSGKEHRVIVALRKIGKEEYLDELLRRVEAAAQALTW